jgi:hypothetical protein
MSQNLQLQKSIPVTTGLVLEQFCREENFPRRQSFIPKLPDKNISTISDSDEKLSQNF